MTDRTIRGPHAHLWSQRDAADLRECWAPGVAPEPDEVTRIAPPVESWCPICGAQVHAIGAYHRTGAEVLAAAAGILDHEGRPRCYLMRPCGHTVSSYVTADTSGPEGSKVPAPATPRPPVGPHVDVWERFRCDDLVHEVVVPAGGRPDVEQVVAELGVSPAEAPAGELECSETTFYAGDDEPHPGGVRGPRRSYCPLCGHRAHSWWTWLWQPPKVTDGVATHVPPPRVVAVKHTPCGHYASTSLWYVDNPLPAPETP